MLQRKGRAGRVRSGFGFTLLTARRFELRLAAMPMPEMLRCSLMELMLSARGPSVAVAVAVGVGPRC